MYTNLQVYFIFICVKVFDGELSYSKILDSFCGTKTDFVKSQSNVMVIKYSVKIYSQSKGFLAAYSQGE